MCTVVKIVVCLNNSLLGHNYTSVEPICSSPLSKSNPWLVISASATTSICMYSLMSETYVPTPMSMRTSCSIVNPTFFVPCFLCSLRSPRSNQLLQFLWSQYMPNQFFTQPPLVYLIYL